MLFVLFSFRKRPWLPYDRHAEGDPPGAGAKPGTVPSIRFRADIPRHFPLSMQGDSQLMEIVEEVDEDGSGTIDFDGEYDLKKKISIVPSKYGK